MKPATQNELLSCLDFAIKAQTLAARSNTPDAPLVHVWRETYNDDGRRCHRYGFSLRVDDCEFSTFERAFFTRVPGFVDEWKPDYRGTLYRKFHAAGIILKRTGFPEGETP